MKLLVSSLKRQPKVVVVGGGSGTFNVLRALKPYAFELTAITTTFDSGGSTGVLRDEVGALPAGDIRRALVALVPDQDDQFLRQLFEIRFEVPGSSLHGHNLGNLLIHAATLVTGSREQGVAEVGRLLHIKGRVLPVAIADAHLCVVLEDGTIVKRESNIDQPTHPGHLRITDAWLEPTVTISPEAATALAAADWVIFGPGDLYTSIVANLLVDGFGEALGQAGAKIVFVTNIVTKWGETHGFAASDHLKTFLRYLHQPRIEAVIVNTNELPRALVQRYERENKHAVSVDEGELRRFANQVIIRDFTSNGDILRHHPDRLGQALSKVIG